MASLADVPGLGGYLAQKAANENQPMQQLQQVSSAQGLLAHLQEQEQAAKLREVLAASGGDAEKALQSAVAAGNVKAAQALSPIVKMQQEQKQREETPRLLASLNGAQAPAATAAPGDGAEPATPAAPQDPRQARIAKLTAMSLIPQYANNPIVQQRLQAEIDKLTSVKPMVEHNFSVGENQVQPHISFDEGKSWQPIPGSKPSAKFAKQVVNVNAGGDAGVGPTAETREMDAWRYMTDGTLPANMGRGVQGAAQATQIRNDASKLAKDMGMDVSEIRIAQLTNKNGIQAMGQLAKARAQILQFEKTANSNADLALAGSEKVDRTGVPLFNKWLQAGRTAVAGDTDATLFNTANETFVNEYAKVMSGGYGAAATTEGAQARAHNILNTAQTQETYRENIKQLKMEMANRVKALNGQMEEERGRIKDSLFNRKPAEPAPAPVAPAAPASAGPKDGEKSKSKSGKDMTFRNGQWEYD